MLAVGSRGEFPADSRFQCRRLRLQNSVTRLQVHTGEAGIIIDVIESTTGNGEADESIRITEEVKAQVSGGCQLRQPQIATAAILSPQPRGADFERIFRADTSGSLEIQTVGGKIKSDNTGGIIGVDNCPGAS
jgi:hypothetical protein